MNREPERDNASPFRIPERARRELEEQQQRSLFEEPRDDEPGVGSRGGPRTPLTLATVDDRFRTWKDDEYGWLRDRILQIAYDRGEFHADSLSHTELTERNQIGSAVNALQRAGLIASTGEHRRSEHAAAHGRRSYVYKLTEQGQLLVESAGRAA